MGLALLLLPSLVLGFGAMGHRISGEIAQQYLNPGTALAVSALLKGESLAAASTWADEMRGARDNPEFWSNRHAASWHFVNIPDDSDYEASPKARAGDAYAALLTFTAILKDETLPEGPVKEGLTVYFGDLNAADTRLPLRRLALRFLIHLVGDLHQPLHVGRQQDLGGNRIGVRWFNRRSNLHAVWDTQLVQASGRSVAEMSQILIDRIESLPHADRETIAATPPRQWLDEAMLLRQDIYDPESYRDNLRQDYADSFAPVVETQLMKAGLRLAAVLNAVFE